MSRARTSRERVFMWLVSLPSILTVAFAVAAYRLFYLAPSELSKTSKVYQFRVWEFSVLAVAALLSMWMWLIILLFTKQKRTPRE